MNEKTLYRCSLEFTVQGTVTCEEGSDTTLLLVEYTSIFFSCHASLYLLKSWNKVTGVFCHLHPSEHHLNRYLPVSCRWPYSWLIWFIFIVPSLSSLYSFRASIMELTMAMSLTGSNVITSWSTLAQALLNRRKAWKTLMTVGSAVLS